MQDAEGCKSGRRRAVIGIVRTQAKRDILGDAQPDGRNRFEAHHSN